MWPSAVPFFHYLTKESNIIQELRQRNGDRNQPIRILELGSGTGVLGFSLATEPDLQVILTDPGLTLNLTDADTSPDGSVVQVNTVNLLKESAGLNKGNTSVRQLAWGSEPDIGALLEEFPYFDLIVGSEILYDPFKYPVLFETIKKLSSEDTQVYICGRKRNLENKFVSAANDFDFQADDILPDQSFRSKSQDSADSRQSRSLNAQFSFVFRLQNRTMK